MELTIFSGTIDILELPYQVNGIERFNTAFLNNVTQVSPVPKFFFKVILDETIAEGIVFIGELKLQKEINIFLNLFNFSP